MIDRSFPDSTGAHGCMLQLHSAHLPLSMQTAISLQCVLCLAMDTGPTATFNTLAVLHMIHVLVCVFTLVAQRPMYSHLCPHMFHTLFTPTVVPGADQEGAHAAAGGRAQPPWLHHHQGAHKCWGGFGSLGSVEVWTGRAAHLRPGGARLERNGMDLLTLM